jgi:EmrB/QacA subfamily drug resistance transporter
MPTVQAAPLSAQQNAAGLTDTMRTVALVVVSLAFIMDLLDSTIVNIAIPSIRTNLNATYSAIQWIVAGYALAFALLLVTGGRMGDVYGYKKVFMVGVGGFSIASLLSGLAPGPDWLIAARLLQGGMAALMVPQVMSLMQIMYKPEERGAINGLFGALGGLSASLGPVVGGLLIKANLFGLDWRPIFLINVPIGILGLVLAARYLPDGKSAHPLKLDLTGTFIIIIAMLLLVYPLIQGRELDWPVWSFVMMATSLPAFLIFALWQRHKARTDGSPLVLPELFRKLSFNIGLSVNLIFEAAMLGFFLTFGLFLQIGLGFSPIHAALTGLPVAVGIALTMATLGEKVIPKLGRRALFIGCAVMAIGLSVTSWLLHHYNLSLHSWQLIPGLLVVGIGMGHIFASLYAAVLNGVDPGHAGAASGTLNAVQQVGGAIGIAVIGVIFFGQLSSAAPDSFNAATPALQTQLTAAGIPATAQVGIVNGVKTCFVDRSREKDSSIVPPSCQQAESNPALARTITQAVTNAAAKANATNFAAAFRWGTIYEISLLVLTFCLTFFLPRRFRADAFAEI